MTTRQQALSKIQVWVAQERIEQVKSITRASLTKEAIGGAISEGILGQAMARDGQETILQSISQRIAGALSSIAGPEGLLAASLEDQIRKLNDIKTLAGDLQDNVNELENVLENMPEPPDDYSSVKRLADEVASVSPTKESDLRDDLMGLVEEGILDEEEVDDFIRRQRLSDTPDTKAEQTVEEVSENYYRVTTRERTSDNDLTDGFSFDPDLDEVAGYDDVRLDPDRGVIELSPDQNEEVPFGAEKTIQVQPSSPPTPEGSPRSSGQDTKLKNLKDAAKEDLEYQFAACAALHLVAEIRDIVSILDERLQNIKEQIRGLVKNLLDPLKIDVGVLAKNLTLDAASAILESTNADELFGEIRDLTSNQSYGAQATLGIDGVDPGIDQACKAKHRQACRIRDNFAKLERRLDELLKLGLDSLEDSLSIGLPDLITDLEDALLDPLNEMGTLKQATRELRARICSWIDRRLDGAPEELSELNQIAGRLISAIGGALAVYNSIFQTLSTVQEIQDVVEQIKALKMGGTLGKLFSGDISGFFESLARDLLGVSAGEVAEALKDLRDSAPNIHLEQKYHELHLAAEARARQKTIGRKIREGMRGRRFQNSNVHTAKEIKAQLRAINQSVAQARSLLETGEEEGQAPPSRRSGTNEKPPWEPTYPSRDQIIEHVASEQNVSSGNVALDRLNLEAHNNRYALWVWVASIPGSTVSGFGESHRDQPDKLVFIQDPDMDKYEGP